MRASPTEYTPQFSTDRRPLVMWLLVAAVCLIIFGLIIVAPLALARGHNSWAAVIYSAFSHLCHQMPERSIFIAGHPLAVCSRCTGLYAGFAVTTLCYPLLRSLRQTHTPPRKWLFIAAAPLVVDFAVGFLGISENTHLSRLATGALLGSVAVFYVMPGFVDLGLTDWRRVVGRTAVSDPRPQGPGY